MRERCGGNQCQQGSAKQTNHMSTRGQSDVHKYLVLACIIPPEVFSSSITAVLKGQSKEILENSRGFINSPVLYSSTKVIHVATE
jgi:hypothetical protein